MPFIIELSYLKFIVSLFRVPVTFAPWVPVTFGSKVTGTLPAPNQFHPFCHIRPKNRTMI